MKKIEEGIWSWSVYSDEKKLNFNGIYLQFPAGSLLVDPPSLTPKDEAFIEKTGKPNLILLTNKDHHRASEEARERFGASILIHALDAPLLDIKADKTFANGETILSELEVIHLANMKSPGECALYWKKRGLLILGDALIGEPQGAVRLLPSAKYADITKAFESVKQLRQLDFDLLLLGDGDSIFSGGKIALEKFLNDFT